MKPTLRFLLLFLSALPSSKASSGIDLRDLHGSYSASFMGPRINGTPEETYNAYLPDISSIQLFHSARVGWQVNRGLQLGVGEDLVQNLRDGVIGDTGIIHHRSEDLYDPYLYAEFPDTFAIPGWWITTAATLSLPLTRISRDSSRITSLGLKQTWSRAVGARWHYGFHWFLNPQFYSEPIPEGGPSRQILYCAFGPDFDYRLSPTLRAGLSGHFDVEHRNSDPTGRALASALPDFLQISITWAPEWHGPGMNFGTYFQSLVWEPSWDTSIVGANLSVYF